MPTWWAFEIWKSLDTGDYQKARGRYLEARAGVERQFATVREGAPARMVTDWFRHHDHDMAEHDFASHGPGRGDAVDEAVEEESVLVNGADGEVMPFIQTGAGDHPRPARVTTMEYT